MARKYTRKAKTAEPKVEMYKVTINEDDYGSGTQYNDPVYFTRATSQKEALLKVLPKFFEDHPSDNIENLQVEQDSDVSFVE